MLLKDTEDSKKTLEDELQKTAEVKLTNLFSKNASYMSGHLSLCMKQRATSTVEENKSLKSKLQVAEAVQKQTNSAEQDYEQVIQLLEAEIKDLKNQLAGKSQRSLGATKVSICHIKRTLHMMSAHRPR